MIKIIHTLLTPTDLPGNNYFDAPTHGHGPEREYRSISKSSRPPRHFENNGK